MKVSRELPILILVALIAVPVAVSFQPSVAAQGENKKVPAGSKAPSFSVETLEGETVSLDDYQGKVLILEFFASWCHVCKNTTPELQDVRENFSSENLAMLSIESDSSVPVENVRSFKSEYGGDWAFARSPGTADDYGVEAYPSLFVIGPDGYVVFRNEGAVPPSVLNSIVADVLGVSPPSGGTSGDNAVPSNVIIDVEVSPENAGGIVATDLKINETGEPVFTYKVRANPGYKFVGWAGDVPENQKDSQTLEIIPATGARITAKFSSLGGTQSGGSEPSSGVAGNFTFVSFVLGAVPAGCLAALAGYLIWGRGEAKEEE